MERKNTFERAIFCHKMAYIFPKLPIGYLKLLNTKAGNTVAIRSLPALEEQRNYSRRNEKKKRLLPLR